MKIQYYLYVLVLMFLSCEKDDEKEAVSTIRTDMVPEMYVDSLRQQMDVNEGNTPPDISGEFVADPYVKVYDSKYGVSKEKGDPRFFHIYKKNPESEYYSYYMKEGDEISVGDSMIVIGSGDRFTAYYVDYVVHESHLGRSHLVTVFSGIKTDKGIKNLKYSFVLRDKYDPEKRIMGVGQFRCFIDGDSLSNDTIWDVEARASNFRISTSNYTDIDAK